MELFRWLLILAGICLLALTYFLGRRRVGERAREQGVADPDIDNLSIPLDRRSLSPGVASKKSFAPRNNYNDDEDFLPDHEIDEVLPPRGEVEPVEVEIDISDDFEIEEKPERVTASGGFMPGIKPLNDKVKNLASAVHRARAHRREEPEILDEEEYAENEILEQEDKLVTVHITAPRDQRFSGRDLKQLFEEHGYEFGKMSIYHCGYESERVFSIANMVKPGDFDDQNMAGFQTPGITLFMNLPVALDSDVAFELMIREAQDLADELGGHLRDGDRSTLSKQTIQHMREDIQQYAFRQKTGALA